MADYSVKEAGALVLKASRGAYLTWGLAEEAGYAAGWLLAHGFSVLDSLVALLEENDGKPCRDLGPDDPETGWRPNQRARALCPIITGALMSDSAKRVAAGQSIYAGPVAHPVLLLPFVAELARDCFRFRPRCLDRFLRRCSTVTVPRLSTAVLITSLPRWRW